MQKPSASKRRSVSGPSPRTRSRAGLTFASGCFPYDVDAGRILLGCRRPYAEPIEPCIADTATGAIDRVPGAEPGERYTWLGAFWLRGHACTPGHPEACGQLSLKLADRRAAHPCRRPPTARAGHIRAATGPLPARRTGEPEPALAPTAHRATSC